MPTRTQPPLDYLTRTAIATVEKQLVNKVMTEADARTLLAAIAPARGAGSPPTGEEVGKQRAGLDSQATLPQPDFAHLVRANREMGFNAGDAFLMATKQAPKAYQAWLREAETEATGMAKAQPGPAPSAWETLDGRIRAEQQAHPKLSYVEASDRVNKADPRLHADYILERRHRPEARSRPVEKQALPSVEAILKMAPTQAAAAGITTRAQLEALVTAHPGEVVYYEAYRRWHGSPEDLREHYVREQRPA